MLSALHINWAYMPERSMVMEGVKHPHRKLTKEQRWRKRGRPRATRKACDERWRCWGCPFDGRLCDEVGHKHAFHPF